MRWGAPQRTPASSEKAAEYQKYLEEHSGGPKMDFL